MRLVRLPVVCISVLRCVTLRCSVLQSVAVCCSVLQRVLGQRDSFTSLKCVTLCNSVCERRGQHWIDRAHKRTLPRWRMRASTCAQKQIPTSIHCNILHHTATPGNTLQHTATHYNMDAIPTHPPTTRIRIIIPKVLCVYEHTQ